MKLNTIAPGFILTYSYAEYRFNGNLSSELVDHRFPLFIFSLLAKLIICPGAPVASWLLYDSVYTERYAGVFFKNYFPINMSESFLKNTKKVFGEKGKLVISLSWDMSGKLLLVKDHFV